MSTEPSAEAPHLQIIDMVGLHDRYFAHHGFDVNYLFQRQPDLIWFPHSDYTKIVAEIYAHSQFREEYIYWPNAYNYGLAIRKESPQFEQLYQIVAQHWPETYAAHDITEHVASW